MSPVVPSRLTQPSGLHLLPGAIGPSTPSGSHPHCCMLLDYSWLAGATPRLVFDYRHAVENVGASPHSLGRPQELGRAGPSLPIGGGVRPYLDLLRPWCCPTSHLV